MINRRDFLKGTLAFASLTPAMRLLAKAGIDGDKSSDYAKGAQISRRKFRDTGLTLPLLGFGTMRLPKQDLGRPEVDVKKAEMLFARALEAGVNYFDTAYMYHNGWSEKCIGSVMPKFDRDSYYLASKMPVWLTKSPQDVERVFNDQLERTKAGYFDFYLLHSVDKTRWELAKKVRALEFLKKMREAGKIRHLGFSFHGTPELLPEVLSACDWEFVQIQLNYLDWDLSHAKEQYEIITARNIPIIVMEPLRGGALARLNPQAQEILRRANPKASVASWALRYAASLPNVVCILSGMGAMEHLEDNIATLSNFQPLSDEERKTLDLALNAYRQGSTVPCTACRYCLPCPVGVEIPKIFGLYNQLMQTGQKKSFMNAIDKLPKDSGPEACVKCGRCVKRCPQHINIPRELAKIAKMLKRIRARG